MLSVKQIISRRYGSSSSSSINPSKLHLIPTSGTYPKGFIAGSIATGVKKNQQLDLTVVKSSSPCTIGGVFTTNKFSAAPVQLCKSILSKTLVAAQHDKNKSSSVDSNGPSVYGLVVNSGCANACTGEQGLKDAIKVGQTASKLFNVPESGFMVMSTGVIGQFLQLPKIEKGLSDLASSSKQADKPASASSSCSNTIKMGSCHDSWLTSAKGIMTTDTFPKLRSKTFTLSNQKSFSVAGWSKGAGMIHPNMATMLGALFTDAQVSQTCLSNLTKYIADRSFNAISVDGDTSTNDTFLILANGQSGSQIKDDVHDPIYLEFRDKLTEFSTELATLIVRDGEGATKFVKLTVKEAPSFNDAKQIANTIVKSPLVKTAIYGKDANWGRIVCAVGYSGVQSIDPTKVNLFLRDMKGTHHLHLFKNGAPFDVNEDVASKILDQEDIELEVRLGLGHFEHTMYTCDFSTEYVNINADYRS